MGTGGEGVGMQWKGVGAGEGRVGRSVGGWS